jgi:hypothetical protein
MAVPALKCPFLSQLTLQQVRASAPHIFNAGVESCPIFSQVARRISTSNVHDTGSMSSATNVQSSGASRPMSMDELKAIHEKIHGHKPFHHPLSNLKMTIPTIQSSFNKSKPSPFGESEWRCERREDMSDIGLHLQLSSRLNAKICSVRS